MSAFVEEYNNSNDYNVDELVVMLSSQELSAPNWSPQVTKLIRVPTSEHVAQIVGKCGQCVTTRYQKSKNWFILFKSEFVFCFHLNAFQLFYAFIQN